MSTSTFVSGRFRLCFGSAGPGDGLYSGSSQTSFGRNPVLTKLQHPPLLSAPGASSTAAEPKLDAGVAPVAGPFAPWKETVASNLRGWGGFRRNSYRSLRLKHFSERPTLPSFLPKAYHNVFRNPYRPSRRTPRRQASFRKPRPGHEQCTLVVSRKSTRRQASRRGPAVLPLPRGVRRRARRSAHGPPHGNADPAQAQRTAWKHNRSIEALKLKEHLC